MSTTGGTLKGLQLIHRAMLFGQIAFVAITYFIKQSGDIPSTLRDIDQQLQLVAIVLSFGCAIAGAAIFKKKIQVARDQESLVNKKAAIVRTASIIQWALLEGASLFAVVCFMLVGNLSFLFLAGGLVFFFALTGPSKMKCMLLLRLNEEEMEWF